jgi:TIGR03009 family protein
MRPTRFALLGLLLLAGTATAQEKPPAAAPPAVKDLDGVLQRWEKEMGSVETLAIGDKDTPMKRIDKNKAFNRETQWEGVAQYMKLKTGEKGDKVTNLAALHIANKANRNEYERFICTGDFLYQYVPDQKVIRVQRVPAMGDDNSLISLLFGMKAEDIKKRYEIALTVDADYYYLEIKPRAAADKVDFQRARVVLDSTTFLPRQLWFEEPNGNQITWDLPKIQKNIELNRKTFEAPSKPDDSWKVIEVKPTKADAPPRVIRGGGEKDKDK